MEKKKLVSVYFKPADHTAFKAACTNNDVSMAAKLLDMAKSFTKKESKK